jgi:hypothetical protein
MPEVSGLLSTSISGIVAISGIILQPHPGSGQEQIPLISGRCPSPAYPSTPTYNQTATAAAVSYWT